MNDDLQSSDQAKEDFEELLKTLAEPSSYQYCSKFAASSEWMIRLNEIGIKNRDKCGKHLEDGLIIVANSKTKRWVAASGDVGLGEALKLLSEI